MKTILLIVTAALVVGLAAELALIQPQDLAAQLAAKRSTPAIIHVGPNLLYRGKHIPGAIYAGPASKEAGLDALKVAVDKLPRDRAIVVYCGCCPWVNCPNVKPAVEFLQRMGFAHVKAMYVESNFAKDWIDKGYPVELGTPKP
jgi:3-mercaptopyruvate sulfurtransferase SseA